MPDAKFGKSISDLVAPYRMLIEAEGGPPGRAIGDLLRTAAQLRMVLPTRKCSVREHRPQYGVDSECFAPQIGQQPQPQLPPPDPRIDQLIGRGIKNASSVPRPNRRILRGGNDMDE